MSDGSLFNEFITQIKDCKNLLEAYQMRDAVHQELLSVKTPQPQSVIGGVMAPEYGPDFSVYSLNLENALNLLDRQIQLLSNREKV